MFYESERIIYKNNKYEKLKAYGIISDLKNKGLSVNEQIEAINILLNSRNNEFQTSVLERAKTTLIAQLEIENEKPQIIKENTSNRCERVTCSIISYAKI